MRLAVAWRVLVFVAVGMLGAWALPAGAADPAPSERVAAPAPGTSEPGLAPGRELERIKGEELPGLRTRSSRTFEGPGGLRIAEVSAGSVNYKDRAGDWQPIDNTLTPVDGGFENGANSYRALLPAVWLRACGSSTVVSGRS